MIEPDFSENRESRLRSKIQKSTNTFWKHIKTGNLRAGEFHRFNQAAIRKVVWLRDLCRRNLHYIQAESQAKFKVWFFFSVVTIAFWLEYFVFGQEARSIADNPIIPFLIPATAFIIGVGINLMHSHVKKIRNKSDPRDLGKGSDRLLKAVIALKVVYVVGIVGYAYIATTQVFAVSQVDLNSLGSGEETYGGNESDVAAIEAELESIFGKESEAEKEATYLSGFTPWFIVFLIGLLHTIFMCTGSTVQSAFGFLFFNIKYQKEVKHLQRLRSRRDNAINKVGEAYAAANSQIRNLENLGSTNMPVEPYFSSTTEKVYELFETAYDFQDVDVLREFLDGDELAKYDMPLVIHPTAGYTGDSLPEEEEVLPI